MLLTEKIVLIVSDGIVSLLEFYVAAVTQRAIAAGASMPVEQVEAVVNMAREIL
jgi:hypothetical protein